MPDSFFAASLPDSGYYCIGLRNAEGGFRHRFFEDKERAYTFALEMDKQGETVYYAQGSFHETTNRNAENAAFFRSFFLDIDCGPKKPFKTQADGITALKAFCEATSLPIPSVVNSGTGLYAYWLLDRDLPATGWVTTARVLKGLCEAVRFEVDPVRTADRSSVLRPIGATNRKKQDKTVNVLRQAPVISVVEFGRLLLDAAKKHKITVKKLEAPPTMLNAEFQLEMSSEKPSAHRIADKCAQIAKVRDSLGDVPEPLWYAAIGLLKHTIEAPEIIHEWSVGHPDYSRSQTDRKIEQHKVHASTCRYFHSISPDACVGCPNHGKINSPWRLGLAAPKPVEVTDTKCEVSNPTLPHGFARTDKGIVYDDGEGPPISVFPYDIYPVKLTQDETLGQEIMCMRAKDPHTGWFDVTYRTALLHDQKQLLMCLADQGVHPYYGKNERNLFMALLSGFMQELKDNRRKAVLSQQMGWYEEVEGELSFVLGDRIISKRGVETVGIAKQADAVVKSISKTGSADKWKDTTKILDKEGLEPWAFTLAALGFGAPLMKFTGYKGSMLSMVGKSGLGKTAMGWWSLSIWGNPDKLQMIQRDTHNATVARMSLYNNLPLFIDEITNIKKEVLSDLAYQITQGRDKHSLTRSRQERSAMTWATIGAGSSNTSLVDILGGYKSDPSAEINRIFEYEFPNGVVFDGVTAYKMFMHNYGHVGEEYAKYLVDHQDEHAENLLKVQKGIERMAECKPEERFWAVTAACALYGASIAKKLGMFHVGLPRLTKWVISTINRMRGVKDDTVVDSTSWLGTFLSKHASNMLVCRHMKDGMWSMVSEPRGPLYIRKDDEYNTVWISRDLLKRELMAGSASYQNIKKELIAQKILVADNKRMVLGKGTMYASVTEICWELKLDVPTAGQVVAQLVRREENDKILQTSA